MLRPILKPELPDQEPAAAVAAPRPARKLGAPLDLVHLARQSLGDKPREMELLGRFDQQATLASARLHAAGSPAAEAEVVRMLGASARLAGAFAVAAACDAYAATLGVGGERDRAVALEILQEEIGIARDAIADLFHR